MKNRMILLVTVLLPCYLFSQTLKEGQNLFNNGKFEEARQVYNTLIKKHPEIKIYYYLYARCCYELNRVDEAIQYFEKSERTKKYYPARRNYLLGDLYVKKYRFDDAIASYKDYITFAKKDDKLLPEVRRKTEQARKAKRLLKDVEDVLIIDSIVVDKTNFILFYTEITKNLGRFTITKNGDDGDYETSYKTLCNSYHFFSKKNLKTKKLELYKSPNDTVGHFPITLAEDIKSNKNFPFFNQEDMTLFFASDGKNSIGGYDIFSSKYNSLSDKFLAPQNIGMPFNSPFNDYMMVVDHKNSIGWFASDRYLPEGKIAIYTFIPNKQKKTLSSKDEEFIRSFAQIKINNDLFPEKTNYIDEENPETRQSSIFTSIIEILNDTTGNKKVLQHYTDLYALNNMLITLNNENKLLLKSHNCQDETEQQELTITKMRLGIAIQQQKLYIKEKETTIKSLTKFSFQ